MKYQIWSVDEYNQSGIESTTENIDEAISFIKKEVHNKNFSNALTRSDQMRSLEAYYPVFIPNKSSDNIVYAGNITDGKHRYYSLPDNNIYIYNNSSIEVRFFIGFNKDGNDIYMMDDREEKYVNAFLDNKLKALTYYFIKVV